MLTIALKIECVSLLLTLKPTEFHDENPTWLKFPKEKKQRSQFALFKSKQMLGRTLMEEICMA